MPYKGHCLEQTQLGSCSLTYKESLFNTWSTAPKLPDRAQSTDYLPCVLPLMLYCPCLHCCVTCVTRLFSTFHAEKQLKSSRATTGLMAKAVKLQHPFIHPQAQGSRQPGHGILSRMCVCKAKLMLLCKGSIYISHTCGSKWQLNGTQPHKWQPNPKYLGVFRKAFKNNSVYIEMKSNIAKTSCY